jgi:hypothetical protein
MKSGRFFRVVIEAYSNPGRRQASERRQFSYFYIYLKEDRAGTGGLWRTAGMSLEIKRKILTRKGGATTDSFYNK